MEASIATCFLRGDRREFDIDDYIKERMLCIDVIMLSGLAMEHPHWRLLCICSLSY